MESCVRIWNILRLKHQISSRSVRIHVPIYVGTFSKYVVGIAARD